MKFHIISQHLNGLPHTPPADAKILYDFIIESRVRNILELGFEHGTSTCYLPAALDEIGSGLVTTINNQTAKTVRPNICDLLDKTGSNKFINPIFAYTSYTWELMRMIENQTIDGLCKPLFDFCFIDGAHTWEVDGLSFFLVEKLLLPGGWILFDDLDWTFASSHALKNTDRVKIMPDDE